MKKYTFYILIGITPIIDAMQPQEPKAPVQNVTKDQLIQFVKKSDAKSVLFALTHQGGSQVIDEEVIEVARKHHKGTQGMSRSGSILLMLAKHTCSPLTPASESPKSKDSIAKSSKKHSHKHIKPVSFSDKESNKEEESLSPKDKLIQLIKEHDLTGLQAVLSDHPSYIYFIDQNLIGAAQDELTKTTQYLILESLRKYVPEKDERRKSYQLHFYSSIKSGSKENLH